MAAQELAPGDHCMLSNGAVQQLEHGALFLLSPLFCGLICMCWCSLLQMFLNALVVRRRFVRLRLRRLRLRTCQESDRGDQQNNVQQLFLKQISTANSSNRLSRKLSKRTSGLGQGFNLSQENLVDSEKQLLDCQKENIKLQEELSEVNLFKSKLVELLKRENEEKAKLEKQQSVFQSQAFTAICERDRLISEVEKFQKKEDEMTEKLTDFQDRLDQVESRYTQGRSLCTNLQKEVEGLNQDVLLYRKVIDKFWRVRAKASEVDESASSEERAAILLQDDENYWSYGDLNKQYFDETTQARKALVNLQQESDVCRKTLACCQAEHLEESCARKHAENAVIECRQQLVNLQQEIDVCRKTLACCQAEHLEESSARKHAENAVTECRQQLVMLAKQLTSELQQLNAMQASLKEDVSGLLQEETNSILSLQDAWQQIREKMRVTDGDSTSELNAGCFKEPSNNQRNTCCSTGDLVVDELRNGGLATGTNVCNNNINGNAALAKLDLSSRDDQDLVEVAAQVSREDELTKAVLTTCDEITNPTIKISSVQEDSDVMQEDDWNGKKDATVDEFLTVPSDDSKEALAQALQEKVAALLLLSQQEERHILESNTTVFLESEIASLKQQLLQVTSEKVGALMKLAQVHEELRKLQESFKQKNEHGHTLSSGQLSPVEDHGSFFDNDNNSIAAESGKKASMQGYLKHLWLKGPELGARTKSLSHMLTLRSSKETDAVGMARLKLENASMRESLTSIRHLCKSANRLRLTIARVAADSNVQTESSLQAAVEAVDGVISEALHLKVALHSSLPVDDLKWNSIGSPLARASEVDPESSDYDANDDLHIVSFFGLEIVRLVLLAAQLQKRFLGQNV
ncbi:hypothetical protein L7F22_022639 [Adiantum nelumboides]|nr:hypothetical protein [Adiantum nelumboides]